MQAVSFQTNPEDVTVTLLHRVRDEQTDGAWKDETRVLGKTPLTIQLEKEERQTVTLSKAGYKPLTFQLTTVLDDNFWGNIVLGGFFGSTTDSLSGAMYQYSPSQYFVTLVPADAGSLDAATRNGPREQARAFLIRRHAAVIADLHRGAGEDLAAALQLLKIAPGQEAEAVRKLNALAVVYPDAAAFAGHAVELFLP